MKKLASIILACLLSVCIVAPASAEGIDLAAMSTEDLLTLRESLNAELDTRTGDIDSSIGRGVYVVGEDLKAGTYELTCTERSTDILFFWVDVYNSQTDYDAETAAFNLGQLKLGTSAILTVEDGMVVVIDNGSGRLKEIAPTWAP